MSGSLVAGPSKINNAIEKDGQTSAPIPIQTIAVTRQSSRSSRFGDTLSRIKSTDLPPHDTHHHLLVENGESSRPGPSRSKSARSNGPAKSVPLGRTRTVDEEDLILERDRAAVGDGDAEINYERDIEKQEKQVAAAPTDIEHVPCEDDPRKWSYLKKHLVLAMVTAATVGHVRQSQHFKESH